MTYDKIWCLMPCHAESLTCIAFTMRSPWKTWQRFIVHTQTLINPSRIWRGRNARRSEPDKKLSVSVLFSSNRFPSCPILADTLRETQMGGGTFHLWWGFHHREVSPFEIIWESQPSTRRASWRCSVDGSVLAATHPHTSVFNKKRLLTIRALLGEAAPTY